MILIKCIHSTGKLDFSKSLYPAILNKNTTEASYVSWIIDQKRKFFREYILNDAFISR